MLKPTIIPGKAIYHYRCREPCQRIAVGQALAFIVSLVVLHRAWFFIAFGLMLSMIGIYATILPVDRHRLKWVSFYYTSNAAMMGFTILSLIAFIYTTHQNANDFWTPTLIFSLLNFVFITIILRMAFKRAKIYLEELTQHPPDVAYVLV